ncbi:uncharacterized protein LOC114353755 [Ostrinia furnacalis]|uniref:uncharacterized protein LOC114353755 n=1 Tax=Ostrinia furnacalis TaxID=93504 RepID=UPI001040AB96|nr:uncharacterized protein LOC114353755 [Ostrinia furnacalis]
MGKRGKKSSLPEEHHKKKKSDANILDTCNNETVPEEVCKNVKKAKKEHLNEIESTEDICVSETTQNEDNQNTNRKRNKSKNKLKKSVEVTDDIKSVAQEKTISIKPTKIRFVDDAPQVVASGSEQPTKKTKKSKKQNTQENDEEQINEEDIDNFCDELTEEDNVQFDNWVKLIEAKLHAKK